MMENKENTVVRGQRGFTLVELIVVIVILGILAVVAIPKYIDLQDEAKTSAVQGVAGALAGASAMNKAVEQIPGKATTVSTCEGSVVLLEGGMPDGYTISAESFVGGQAECDVVNTADTAYSATFIGYSVSAS